MGTIGDPDDLNHVNDEKRNSAEGVKSPGKRVTLHVDPCILGENPTNDALDSGISENVSEESQDSDKCSEQQHHNDEMDSQVTDSGTKVTDEIDQNDAPDVSKSDLDYSDDGDDEYEDDFSQITSKFSAHRNSRSQNSTGSRNSDLKPSALRATPKVYKSFTEEEPEDETVKRIRLQKQTSVKPPDGGWGWAVVGGCFIAFFLGGGLSRSFTLIYQHMLDVFGQSAAATSATAALFGSVKMCSSPIVSMLCSKFSKRKIAVIGGFITSVAMVLTSFPVSLPYIYFTYGVMAAFGMNMILTPIFIIISEYFKKRRARAMSLAMLGASFGGIAMPPLINLLFSSYNYAGAMLILAGLMFHLCLSGSLFRPVRYSRIRKKVVLNENAKEVEDGDVTDDEGDEDDELPESSDEELPGSDDDRLSWHRNSAKGQYAADLRSCSVPRGNSLKLRFVEAKTTPARSHSLMPRSEIMKHGSLSFHLQPRSHSLKLRFDRCQDVNSNQPRSNSLKLNVSENGSLSIPTSDCKDQSISCSSQNQVKMSSILTFDEVSRQDSETPDYPEGLGPKYLSHYRRIARLAKRQVSFQVEALRMPDKDGSESDFFLEADLIQTSNNTSPCMKRWNKVMEQLGTHLFRQPRFVFYSLLMMCSILSLSISGTFLAGLVLDFGFDNTHTGLMLSVSAIGAIPSKSISGIVFDLKKARPHRSLLLSSLGFLTGTFAMAMSFCSGFIELFIVYVIYSFFASSYHCHQSTVLADIVRTRDVSRAMGLCRLFQGIGFIIGPTMGGFIKDRTGHYKYTFLFSGSVLAGFTLLYTSVELWMKWKRKLLQKRTIPKAHVARCRADSIWSNI